MLRQEIKQTDRMSKESKKEETVREIISVKNLYKLYRVGDSVVRALDGVSFSVYEGEFCAIVGTSGSGKSTLLNMLAGLEKPTRGEVIVAGKHIEQMKENELVKFRGENVGFIFQSFHLMGTMNALENVALPLTFRGEPRKERIKKADRMLDLVSLEKHKKHLPNQLSGGQQQRTAIGRALAKNPKLLLCDEPTGALDYHTSKDILELLEQINQDYGTTILIVTHNDAIAKMAHRVLRLRDGQIISNYLNTSRINAKELEW